MVGSPDAARRRRITYPSTATPFLAWLEGVFEACFVAYHPFIRLPEDVVPEVQGDPSPDLVRTHGTPVTWAHVRAGSRIATDALLNRTLLTSAVALPPKLEVPEQRDILAEWLEPRAIWPPGEGAFQALLEPAILDLFRLGGAKRIVLGDEWGEAGEDHPLPAPGDDARLPEVRSSWPVHNAYPLDHAFLATVDWDSFFMLFCGPYDLIAALVEKRGIEGFWAGPQTSHEWWRDEPTGPPSK